MALFYVTNGKLYVRKVGEKYQTINSTNLATKFNNKNAKKIAQTSFKGFYLVDCETNSIYEEMISPPGKFKLDELKAISENLTKIPPYESCVNERKELGTKLSNIDLKISDIEHWIEVNSPAAHIRCKVFGKLQSLRTERRRIKQTMNYIDSFVKCYEGNLSLQDSKKLISDREYKEYIPRTSVYEELNKLL